MYFGYNKGNAFEDTEISWTSCFFTLIFLPTGTAVFLLTHAMLYSLKECKDQVPYMVASFFSGDIYSSLK